MPHLHGAALDGPPVTPSETLSAHRDIRLLNTARGRPPGCVGCGVCTHYKGANGTARKFPRDRYGACLPGCTQIRSRIAEALSRYRRRKDVVDLSHDHSYRGVGSGAFDAEGVRTSNLSARAVFCLQPLGDMPTRFATYQAMVQGCIPVVNRVDDAYFGQHAFASRIPYRELVWHVPEGEVMRGGGWVEELLAVPDATIGRLRRRIARYAPLVDWRRDALAATLAELRALPPVDESAPFAPFAPAISCAGYQRTGRCLEHLN